MPDSHLRFALAASTLSGDPRAVARRSREIGFGGLQLDARTSALDLAALSDSGRRELRRIFTSQDQQVASLRASVDKQGFGPGADVDRELSGLEGAMEAAVEMGAGLLCLDVGALPEPPATPRPKPKITPEQAGLILLPSMPVEPSAAEPPPPPSAADLALASSVHPALAELGRRADRYSVILALRTELSSIAALEAVLRQANCPWFGVDLDPVALLRDTWSSDEFFSRLGTQVRQVRGRDAVRGTDHRVRPTVIGHGDTHWPQLRADLDGAGYSGWITVDPIDLVDRPAAAVAGLKYLKSVI